MAKLSDTQLVILSAACQRDDRLVLPLPDRLKGGAAAKVITSLIAKGLVKEVRAKLNHPVWHETVDEAALRCSLGSAVRWESWPHCASRRHGVRGRPARGGQVRLRRRRKHA